MKKYSFADKKDTRSGFGAGLLEAGLRNEKVVALCAGLVGSLKMEAFIKAFPERFNHLGIDEADMMNIAAGMTNDGAIPFTASFENFSTGRIYEQVCQRIANSNMNVKICMSHSGLTPVEDDDTQQVPEDIGLMKMLPGMTVINPCDYNQTKAATIAIAEYTGPVYLRFGSTEVPSFTDADQVFEIGKAWMVNAGADVSIFVTGHLVWEAILAGEQLAEMGIDAEIVNIHTIKPLDEAAILKSVAKTRCVVSAEEHNRLGGLGDSIAQVLINHDPVPMEYVAINDSIDKSGKDEPAGIMKNYGLDAAHIVKAVQKVLQRKAAK